MDNLVEAEDKRFRFYIVSMICALALGFLVGLGIGWSNQRKSVEIIEVPQMKQCQDIINKYFRNCQACFAHYRQHEEYTDRAAPYYTHPEDLKE